MDQRETTPNATRPYSLLFLLVFQYFTNPASALLQLPVQLTTLAPDLGSASAPWAATSNKKCRSNQNGHVSMKSAPLRSRFGQRFRPWAATPNQNCRSNQNVHVSMKSAPLRSRFGQRFCPRAATSNQKCGSNQDVHVSMKSTPLRS